MSGYDQFFKKKRENMKAKKTVVRSRTVGSHPAWMIIIATILTASTIWYLSVGEEAALKAWSHVEVRIFGQASAEEHASTTDKSSAEKSASKAGDAAKEAGPNPDRAASVHTNAKSWSEEEITLFTKLESRKKELDAKEAELKKMEEELQKQKDELEKRISSLEEVRDKIAAKLETKVKVDQQKVESLISVYSSMKPSQAAKVIEGINEDLAVEVLAKMKNKNAAEILNLMDAEKAKRLSERFAGYREPAAAK